MSDDEPSFGTAEAPETALSRLARRLHMRESEVVERMRRMVARLSGARERPRD